MNRDDRAVRTRARYELPELDRAALNAAREVELIVARADEVGSGRWTAYLGPLVERLRDGDVATVKAAAVRARAAYGPQDSVRDILPPSVGDPCRDAIDRLLRVIARLTAAD